MLFSFASRLVTYVSVPAEHAVELRRRHVCTFVQLTRKLLSRSASALALSIRRTLPTKLFAQMNTRLSRPGSCTGSSWASLSPRSTQSNGPSDGVLLSSAGSAELTWCAGYRSTTKQRRQ